jgi:DNA-binding SARP family transcriptional activator
VDAWAFERMLDEALRISDFEFRNGKDVSIRNSTKSEILQRLEKALQLYQGRFLAGDEGRPWVASPRERLKAKFLRAVSLLGNHWECSKKYPKAIECYHKGLEVDDLAEELYQHLMLCHLKLGRKADAVKTYRRCRDMLQTNLGVGPSEETEMLYRKIMI